MVAGLVIVPLVSLCTAKPDRALVEDAFSCYDEKVLVRQSQALGTNKFPLCKKAGTVVS